MRSVHLFQPNYEFSGTSWLPYSAGCLWAAAMSDEELRKEYRLGGLHFRRAPYERVLDSIETPAVAAFSTYVWNSAYNRGLARRIKDRWPETKIVFGGPEVPNDPQQFLQENPAIDCVVHQEGELSFRALLRELLAPRVDLHSLNGISFRSASGKVVTLGGKGRVEDLSNLPSPYLSGVFDTLMAQHPTTRWAGTLETNRGCPYKCHFCDWGSLVFAKVKLFDEARVAGEIDWLGRHEVDYVFVADANFGMFRERDGRLVEHMLDVFERRGHPRTFCVQWTKSSNRHVVDLARRLGPVHKGLTLSVQSMSPDVLTAIERRNMPIQNLGEMLALSEEAGVPAYTELILGLPEETRISWRQSLHQLLELGQHSAIDVWMAQVLRNSEMGSPAARQRHQIETVSAVDYFFGAGEDDAADVPESIELVRSTRTLPFDDLVESYMYAWMVMNLHLYGWTQLAARFLHTHGGISYRTFYDRLFDFIADSPDSWLGRELATTRNLVRRYLTDGTVQMTLRDEIGLDLGIAGHNLMWRSQMIWRFHGQPILAEISDFLAELTPDLDADDRADLLQAQRHAVLLHGLPYPFEFQIGSNLVDAALGKEVWQRRHPTRYRVDYRSQLKEQVPEVAELPPQSFLTTLYLKRRCGAGIADLRRLDD